MGFGERAEGEGALVEVDAGLIALDRTLVC